jgi:hypothetical protein
VTLKIHDEPTDYDRNCAEDAHGIQAESTIASLVVLPLVCEKSNDGSQGYKEVEQDERKSLAHSIREIGHDHGKTKSSSPWRDGMKLRLNRGIAVSRHDSRDEVGKTCQCVRKN